MALDLLEQEPLFDVKQIIEILPHRYPFLLVDRILEMDLERDVIIGQKNLTMNEQFFQGHFPHGPIMPGVLILEALAQTGAVLVSKKLGDDRIAVLLKINDAKFRNPARPGDVLFLHCEGIYYGGKGGRVKGRAMVGNKLAVQAEIGFAFMNADQI